MSETPDDPIRAARDEFESPEVTRGGAAMSPTGEQEGDQIGRYRLQQQIGEGGMGTVWMAEQKEPVRRQVALKIIKLGMDTKEVVIRFEAERQALALMEHPSIAKVFDGGATEAGRPYFAMELVRGVPITTYCDQVKAGLRERLELFARVCEAVQHAHQKGVIHRDIKPSNVMVTLADSVPVPKVIDFGIAKATSAELTQKTMFTRYAQMIGTPEYMAPEQAELSALGVDTRADVYSLGVLLYELLTGTKPFEITQLLEQGYESMLRTIREVDPAKPSTRVSTLGEQGSGIAANRHVNVGKLSQTLRGDLDWIVMKALEKDRNRRYDSASGLAADVGRFMRQEPVLAAPPSRGYRLRKLVARRRKTVIAGTALATIFCLGAAGTAWGYFDAKAANVALTDALAEVRQVSAFQAAQLADIDPYAMGLALRANLLESAGEARADLEKALDGLNFTDHARVALDSSVFANTQEAILTYFVDRPRLQADLLDTLAQTADGLGLYETALRAAEEEYALRRSMGLVGEPEAEARALWKVGAVKRQLGRLDEAEADLRAALGMFRSEGRPPTHDELTAMNSLAVLLAARDPQSAEALALTRQAYEGFSRLHGMDAVDTLQLAANLGSRLRQRGEQEEAGRFLEMAFTGLQRVLGPEHVDAIAVAGNWGTNLADRKRFAEAEEVLTDAVAHARRVLGDDHPGTLTTRRVLAAALLAMGRHDEAEPILREILAQSEQLSGEQHVETLETLAILCKLRADTADWIEAKSLAALLYERRVALLGERDPATLDALRNLLAARLALNEIDGLEPQLVQLVEARRQEVNGDDVRVDVALLLLGSHYLRAGQTDQAKELLQPLVERRTREHGAEDEVARRAQATLAAARMSSREVAKAEASARLAHEEALARFGSGEARTAVAALNWGASLRQLGRDDEAKALFEEAHGVFVKALGPQHFYALACQGELAWVMFSLGDLERAQELFESIIEASRDAGGQVAMLGHRAAHGVGELLLQRGEVDEGLAAIRRAHAGTVELVGKDHAFSLSLESKLGLAQLRVRAAEDSEAVLRRALEGAEAADNPESQAMLQHHLALPLLRTGRLEEALGLAEAAVAYYQRESTSSSREWLHAERVYAEALVAHGDVSAARKLCESRVVTLRAAGPSEQKQLAAHLAVAARLALASGDANWIRSMEGGLREAVAIRTRLYPEHHPNVWARHWVMSLLGAVLVATHDTADSGGARTRLAEARELIVAAAEKLATNPRLVLATGDGIDLRAESARHAVALFEAWARLEPEAGHGERAEAWRARAGG